MKVLVVGSGGREHALCWALKRDLPRARLFCAPGNPGTAELAENLPVGAEQLDRIADAADTWNIDLVIVGPEAPLARGLADRLRARGRAVFGPSAAAARIEASKAFAKEVMAAAHVPTAPSQTFSDLASALAHLERHPEPLVVKASGLAGGKGAIVCGTREEARQALRGMLLDGTLGDAGKEVVIERFLEGEEVSVLAISNGRDVVLLPPSQDHKRLLAGDQGPNTGGMGAYSPVSIAGPDLLARVEREIFRPTLEELARRDAPFVGVLYAGLMLDSRGDPWVIEFNCRLGDPEAQAILPRLKAGGGLIEVCRAAAAGEPLPPLEVDPVAAVTTVLAARGYPEAPERGAVITLPDPLPEGVLLFHGSTARNEAGAFLTNGGRILAVTGVAGTFVAARAASRAAAEAIDFDGKQYRPDIAWREAARSSGIRDQAGIGDARAP